MAVELVVEVSVSDHDRAAAAPDRRPGASALGERDRARSRSESDPGAAADGVELCVLLLFMLLLLLLLVLLLERRRDGGVASGLRLGRRDGLLRADRRRGEEVGGIGTRSARRAARADPRLLAMLLF